jgi:hypothetical protein
MPELPERPEAAALREIRDVVKTILDPKNLVPADLHAEQIALALTDRGFVKPNPVDRVEQARAARPPVKLPDREELAFTLFATDNRNAPPEVIRADYDRLRAEQAAVGETFYCDPLADAAIEAFRLANS